MRSRTVLLGTMLLATVLAGCSSGGEDAGLSIDAPADPVNEPFSFRAGMSADKYVWDFGDGSAPAEGREAEHVYGVSSGTVTVTLKTTKDGETETFTEELVIGDGANAAPQPLLQIGTDWAVTGETFRASGAASTDPDGDPILFSFHCIFLGELVETGGEHAHGGGGGTPFVGPQVSKFPAEVAELGPAERTVEGDFCANVRGDGFFSSAASVEGAFATPGLYRILMLARDPVHPSISGFTDVYVSAPADKPDVRFSETFSGTFTGGGGGSGQALCDTAAPGTVCDFTSHSFTLDLPANALWINITNDDASGVAQISWQIFKGNKALASGSEDGSFEDPETYGRDAYRLELTLDAGANVGYTATVDALYDIDPTNKYEAAH